MKIKKPKLHPKWKKLHKTYSVISLVLITLVNLIEIGLPYVGIVAPMVSQQTYNLLVIGVSLFGIVGRYLIQFSEDK